jgi:peptide/nickel transport system substrate-binding protein
MDGRERFVGAVTAVACLVLTACGAASESRASDPDSSTLRIGVGQVASSGAQGEGLRFLVQSLTIENLATLTDEGRPRPSLAKDWTVSADGVELTINLVPGAKFHDGSMLTGAIVARALQATLPDTMGPALEDVDGVSALNDHQVVVRFRRPSPFILDLLEVPIQKPGAPPIGTGPHVLSDPKSLTEFRGNANYYLGRPAIDRVVVTTFPSVRSAWAEMLRGRLDMLWDVGTDALDSLETSTNVSMFTYTRRYQYILAFNSTSDVFQSRQVRRALNMAIDKKALVREALNGRGLVSSGPVWPHNSAFRADFPAFRVDTQSAAATLSNKRGTARRAGRLHFTCLVPPDAVNERIALVLKRQLAAVDVDMSVEETSMNLIVDAMKNRRFEAALIEGVSGPTLLRPYQLWHSKGARNPGGLGSATMDVALDSIRHANSDDEYLRAVANFQQTIVDDPPAVFLAWIQRSRAVSKRFIVPPTEPGRDIMATLRLWKPATEAPRTGHN